MTTVLYKQDMDISAAAAWAVLSDFGGFLEWGTGGQGSIELDGDGIGMVRKMDIPGTGNIEEKMVLCDQVNRILSYQLVGGQPIGMAQYLCVVKIEKAGDNCCQIDWQGEFNAAPGLDAAQVADVLKGSYIAMSRGIGKYAKTQ